MATESTPYYNTSKTKIFSGEIMFFFPQILLVVSKLPGFTQIIFFVAKYDLYFKDKYM